MSKDLTKKAINILVYVVIFVVGTFLGSTIYMMGNAELKQLGQENVKLQYQVNQKGSNE